MKQNESKAVMKDAKKLFMKLGACSSTLFYILNREFGHPRELEVRAAEPLAGGIMQNGYQCGMLWGAVMAVGAEAYRRFDDRGQAIAIALTASQDIMESFKNRTGYIDCIDVTETDWHNKLSIAKFMLTGKFLSCFKLVEKWAPEAILAANEALSGGQADFLDQPISCASEAAQRMGASEEQVVTVAGLAGGMGLSGNACGALGAAIWMKTIKWYSENPKKSSLSNPYAKKTFEAFQQAADFEFQCHTICGRRFESLTDHTEFIKNGGCEQLIDVLVES